jgi:trans-aconitate methyltransferase
MADPTWEDYYAAIEGRPPRQLFLDAIVPAGATGLAIDLGCGDGTETRELLRARVERRVRRPLLWAA